MSESKQEKSFSAQVWEKLSSIDVSGRTKEKNGLTYLSWAWSWGTLMENYPESKFKYMPLITYPDGTCAVEVKVTVKEGNNKISRTIRLAVLSYNNKAIENPSASDISNASMRCLTKCISLFGLAHYIYANEDMPEASKQEQRLKNELFSMFKAAIETNDGLMMAEVAERMNEDWWKASYNSFKTQKTEQKRNVDRLLSEGSGTFRKCVQSFKTHKENGDDLGMAEEYESLSDYPFWQARLKEVTEQ